ncbi:MAG: UDP-N-acetylglucosamine--N-acetylmuramyl-(pentapeptide) pyrophosphoryl-undecaprenol N-acetylglucosamine transferase [Patescibacteria group bacterium]|nr:MAG: UDP-N-acetylglucosamine--N-acetylmuramyl-(pentapeptide) pyrophosphoryl-undecaprenol N-acetylglucosamine transferase [Patescibacteria group bacterium]
MRVGIIGGHLSPALSVIDRLLPEHSVVFFGRQHTFEGDDAPSLEYLLMRERNIPFVSIKTSRLQRRFTKNTLPSLLKFPLGFSQAWRGINTYKIDIVLSFGGYLSLPVCLAAKIKKIPIVIHEQTLEAGLANKIVSKFADKVCISWDSSRPFFPKEKLILTGNPIRIYPSVKKPNIPLLSKEKSLPLIYITGGSAGSHAINLIVEEVLEDILTRYRVIHQTGNSREFHDFERISQKINKLPDKLRQRIYVTQFVHPMDIPYILEHVAWVIGRSGINTVTELLYFGVPALLIPLPYGQQREQEKNAKFLEHLGVAKIIYQQELNGSTFLRLLATMEQESSLLKSRAKEKKFLVREDAAERIVTVLYDVFKKKTSQKREKTTH